MPTDYPARNRSGLHVRKSPPLPPAGGNHAAAQREERENRITLPFVGFQHRRLPGEMEWARQKIEPKT